MVLLLVLALLLLPLALSTPTPTPSNSDYIYVENRKPSDNSLLGATYYWEGGLIGKCTATVFLHTYESKYPREPTFYPNPNLADSVEQPSTNDYTGSGYDRGHMSASADNNWDEDAIHQSFYVTNIAPQDSYTNESPWARIENAVRAFSRTNQIDLYIVTCTHGHASTLETGLAVPEHYYKLVCQYNEGGKMMAFVGDNSKTSTTDEKHARTAQVMQMRDVQEMLDSIGETFDALTEFKDSYESVSEACSRKQKYNEADWPQLLGMIESMRLEEEGLLEQLELGQEQLEE